MTETVSVMLAVLSEFLLSSLELKNLIQTIDNSSVGAILTTSRYWVLIGKRYSQQKKSFRMVGVAYVFGSAQ